MTQPTSRATLKDYAKRQLGHPVVELNLDDDQMEDRIDDALEFFQEYHFDGTFPTFLKHQITASTLKITSNVRELVGAINRIISFSRIYNKLPSLSETKIILKDF